MTTYYCRHCGKPRPLKPGYLPLDERFGLVLCGTAEDPREYEAMADEATIERYLAEKKAKALAKAAATRAAKKAAEDAAQRRHA